jgi:flagellar FliJ protein
VNKRSSRLHRIVTLAEAEERQHGALTGRWRARLTEQLDRLDELGAYRRKYLDESRQAEISHSAHWQDRQNFLHRLDQAVRSQQRIVRDCERNFEMHRKKWQQKRQRVESLVRVTDRFRADEQSRAERLEQRRLDDRPMPRKLYEGDG